jgi:hypothetical protein
MAAWLAKECLVDADCQETSEQDPTYNCIGYAAEYGRRRYRHWWPSPGPPYTQWPPSVPATRDLSSFEAAFATLGYERCDSDALEPGRQKIAIFVNSLQWVTHAAIQLENGMWSSKMGTRAEDISHPLRQIEGLEYGTVARIMSRPRPGSPPPAAPPAPNAPPSSAP